MENKKNPKLDYSRYTFLFFNIGLVISLSLVLIAFEWKSFDDPSIVQLTDNSLGFEEVIEEVPLTEQTPPPPQKIIQPRLVEIPDEEQIEEEIDIDLDIEMTEETEIEEVVFEQAPEEEEADEVFSVVEEMPSFPGGNPEFYKWVGQNLSYPSKARKAEVEGRVIVRFVVDKGGSISDVEVLKGIGFGCDEEAVRVIQQSPDWNPGKQRGKTVKVRVTVPLMFKLS